MFVNLLDLNDNDPTFQNLPFVAEVLEGTPAGVSVYQVSGPHLVPASQQAAVGARVCPVLSTLQGRWGAAAQSCGAWGMLWEATWGKGVEPHLEGWMDWRGEGQHCREGQGDGERQK